MRIQYEKHKASHNNGLILEVYNFYNFYKKIKLDFHIVKYLYNY